MTEDETVQASARGPHPHGHVTLEDVARHVGVSAQSVSNALNNPARVAPATRDRILAAVTELGYRPNRSARALRNQRSRLIGVKVEASRGDRAALLLDQFLHALAESAGAAGCHLILCQSDDEAGEIAAYRELLDTTSVDAFVLTSTHAGDGRVEALRRWGVPVAAFGRSWDGDEDLAWVDVDGRAGIRAATEHVAAQGHRRIAHVGWPLSSETGRDRRAGWRDACTDLGLDTVRHAEVPDDFAAGRAATHRLLDAPDPATALICASDTIALGALRALSERGLRAGADVAVTGFDNSPAAALTTPGLTSLHQPLEQVAHDLIATVEEILGGTPSRRQTLLRPELVIRESSLRGATAQDATPTKETR
ncbi:LacI family DNA-binding transcriptional regulator [Nocardioides panaciterrulae]|uniref:LacI family transcriptional regulator n=1 Tax=Nocardioides panaciterrulae TaxID=661492 RepID=A0A7Y9E4J0_9ACTN|nr:LacI family DNA-binding transcriptional regulator [Nocardioides panaciterrulae]NYD40832.1 LacI family transcriptional regulator [Nocardioides panaciterrulae]